MGGYKPYYSDVRKKRAAMDCATAGKKRWQGMTKAEISEVNRQSALKRWARVREEQARAAEDEARAS